MTAPAKQSTRQRKLVCDGFDAQTAEPCGCVLRTSMAAMGRYGLPTCGCGHVMRFDLVDDAAQLAEIRGDDQILNDHPGCIAQHGVDLRSSLRNRRKGLVSVSRQCGGCRRFVRPNETCRCGFTNQYSGNRNVGGYLGLPADADRRKSGDDLPF